MRLLNKNKALNKKYLITPSNKERSTKYKSVWKNCSHFDYFKKTIASSWYNLVTNQNEPYCTCVKTLAHVNIEMQKQVQVLYFLQSFAQTLYGTLKWRNKYKTERLLNNPKFVYWGGWKKGGGRQTEHFNLEPITSVSNNISK